MSDLDSLLDELTGVLGASATFWPGKTAKLDDYYEVFLWTEVLKVALKKGWSLDVKNSGPKKDEFCFRRGPGLFSSSTHYTYAILKKGARRGELHTGIRIAGESTVLHEFDIVAIDGEEADAARTEGREPKHTGVNLHIEAKFYASDLVLGIGRELVGLGRDCPTIHPFLVSKAEGPDSIRILVKFYKGTYVHNAFPTSTGMEYLHSCIGYALDKW